MLNEWSFLKEMNLSRKLVFDAVVANRLSAIAGSIRDDGRRFRFKSYGLAPKSAADFAFLLNGFISWQRGYNGDYLPHAYCSERERRKKSEENCWKTATRHGFRMPANLFFSTGIPVCILVLKNARNLTMFYSSMLQSIRERQTANTLLLNISQDCRTYQSEKKKTILPKISMAEMKKTILT
jgi:type I restriction enzyme M protein